MAKKLTGITCDVCVKFVSYLDSRIDAWLVVMRPNLDRTDTKFPFFISHYCSKYCMKESIEATKDVVH